MRIVRNDEYAAVVKRVRRKEIKITVLKPLRFPEQAECAEIGMTFQKEKIQTVKVFFPFLDQPVFVPLVFVKVLRFERLMDK